MRTAAQTAVLLAIVTLGSKFFGFVREILMANYYGTTYITDAYVIATSIPSMIFAGILGAIATSFIPIYSKKRETEGELQADLFTSQTINMITIVAIVSSLIGIVFSDQLVYIFTRGGFVGETAAIASFYVKVTFSFTFFTSTAGIMEAYLKYKNVFISPTIAGYSVSIVTIIFIVISHYTSPYYLVFGMLVGNAIRALIVFAISGKHGYHHKLNFHVSQAVKDIFRLALPVFIGSTVGQINLFVNKSLAAGLSEGSAAAINYSDLVIGLITGITTTIVASILYPKMAQAFSQKDMIRYSGLYNSGVSILLMIGIPFTAGLMLYGEEVIQIIFERGVFDGASTELTYNAFFYYSIGIAFSSLQGFLIQTFYSMHNTRTPLIIAIICMVINMISNLILVNYMAHAGLALGGTISVVVSVISLFICIVNFTEIKVDRRLPVKIIKLILSSLIAVGISYLFFHFVGGAVWMPKMVLLGITVMIAVGVYLIILRMFKIEELVHIKEIFRISN